MRTQTQNAVARLVLTFLAAHTGRDLLAWPSQATLAQLCGVTKRTVRNALRELEHLQEIRVITHGQGRGSTVYRLDLLADDFELIERIENRNNHSGLRGSETGRTGPVSKISKPERDDRKTGSSIPKEEQEKEAAPSTSASPTGFEGGKFAEKREAAF